MSVEPKWKPGDRVHSTRTGLPMTVVEVEPNGWIDAYHHESGVVIMRRPDTVIECTNDTHPSVPPEIAARILAVTKVRKWVLELPHERPPLNLNQRLHWAAKHKLTQSLRSTAYILAKGAGIPLMGRVKVTLVWDVPDNRRRDEDNPVPTLKALCDGLVDAGVVVDDTFEMMRKSIEIVHTPRKSALRIVIQEVE